MSSSPNWVQEMTRKYFTRTISQFILHGNTADFVRSADATGQTQYVKFNDYLLHHLFRRRDLVLTYDRAVGLSFRDADAKKDFQQVFLPNYDLIHRTTFAQQFPADPALVLLILERYFLTRLTTGKKIALVIDFAETLVPAGSSSYYGQQDRAILVFLQRWARDSTFLQSDMTTVLVAENLNDLNQQLVRDPHSYEVEVPFPDEPERGAFVAHYLSQYPDTAQRLEMNADVLAQQTAGLNCVQLNTMLSEIRTGSEVFTHVQLKERKKEIIESEAGGLLGFVETRFSLDDVAGHAAAKDHLRAAARALKAGRPDVMPMGYLVNGPVGTGKTFLISCFASDIGIPMVELKNFRSQWQGVTESNLERVLKLLRAMSPVAVMIDEADAYLGNRSQQGDSGVSNRVFSMIASFMSNTEHRGLIIWFLVTARPDLMPVDLKRQGRAEEHIALFYPESLDEKKELFKVMLRKTKIQDLSLADFSDEFFEHLNILSGADMEAALTRAKFKAAARDLPAITVELVQEVFDDFIPPTYPEEVELMNYVAVMECTSKELLPPRFRSLTRAEVIQKVQLLKAQIQAGRPG